MNFENQLEDLLDQWEDSIESGSPVSPESLCAATPELLQPLLEKIQALQKVNAIIKNGPLQSVTDDSWRPSNSGTEPLSIKFDSSLVDLQLHDRGGIGVVYRAVDFKLNRNVAIKFIQNHHAKNEQLVKRFRQEAEITGRLDHPGVVPVYALGQTDKGQPFYSMRFIRGDSLDSSIAKYHEYCGHVEPDKCKRELRKLLGSLISVCRTIAYAHTRGIVHRDIKPQNVMLGKYGETLVVDWGLALPIDRDSRFKVNDETTLRPQLESSIRTDMGDGTPVYMSPEQVAGRSQIMPASDIFSLGVTMFKVLTGKLAFDGDSPLEVRERILNGDFPSPRLLNPSVAPELESICLKAMSLEPLNRYETASDMADDIEFWLADIPVSAHRYTLWEKLGRWSRNHQGQVRSLMASLIMLCLASLLGALFFFVSTRDQLKQQGNAKIALQIAKQSQIDSLKMTSQLIAQSITNMLETRLRSLEQVAMSPALVKLVTGDSPWEQRNEIESILHRARNEETDKDEVETWFALDAKGNLLARSSDDLSVIPLDQPHWPKPYFHGGEFNLTEALFVNNLPAPIKRSNLSPVFVAFAKGRRLFCLSVPVFDEAHEVKGVIGLSLPVGHLQPIKNLGGSSQDRIVSLVESRGELAGTLVYHTGLSHQGSGPDQLAKQTVVAEPELIQELKKIKSENAVPKKLEKYLDPTEGEFAGDWIALALPITIASRTYGELDCGWYLIVQDRPFDPMIVNDE